MMKHSGDIVCYILEFLPVGVCIIDSAYTTHYPENADTGDSDSNAKFRGSQ